VNKVSLNAKEIYVAEMNLGQYFLEVERVACKNSNVHKITKVNGELITPEEIVQAIGGNK
jgi:2-oxoglutarate ferredoxin oxidoreductase subunit alpha